MTTSYQPAPSGANDPPATPHQAVEAAPEPPEPERPWGISPAAWLATLATIRELADSPTWWRVWCIIHQRRPSIPWDGATYHQLWAYWDQERQARGLESLGPWSTAPEATKEGKRR